MIEEPDYLTVKELAEKICMSEKFVRNHLVKGDIPGAIKMGRQWRFKRSVIEKHLAIGQLLIT